MRVLPLLAALLLPALAAGGCASDCAAAGALRPGDTRCGMEGWPDRDVVIHVPAGWDGASPLPLVVARHGHSGTGAGFDKSTCEAGERGGPNCLDTVADAEGFAVAYPDGTGGVFGFGRSWNAGGGDGVRCVGEPACSEGVDDVKYDDDLFALLLRLLPVDTTRVYATGMSNGAAMSHRLACERPERYAAVVAVSGANEASVSPGCTPDEPVPILQIHGTGDPCWGYDGTVGDVCSGQGDGDFVSVDASMAAWAALNGCRGDPTETPLDNPAADGLTTSRFTWPGCAADTELLRVEGGGHAWPGGWQYLSVDTIGPVTTDFSASREAWAFMAAHSRGDPP